LRVNSGKKCNEGNGISARKIALWSIVVAVSILFFAEWTPLYRIRVFRCQNTGSVKGYRQFPLGARTALWEETSALETFVRANFPQEFTNRWEQFVGSEVNYRGQRISWAHFRPALMVERDTVDRYVATLTDVQKKELYDFLRTADRDSAIKKSRDIFEAVYAQPGVKR